MRGRRSGLSAPLFSLTSTASWGIGEFTDFVPFARWAGAAGQSAVQILPIGELTRAERSPYSAMTAMALDPTYIHLPALQDFGGLGAELAFEREDTQALEAVRRSPRIAYEAIRDLKERWLRRSWDRFLRLEVAKGTPRARHFEAFTVEQAWWLDEYALFRALHARHRGFPWWQWPAPLAAAEPQAVARARSELYHEMSYRKYLQWVAAQQWAEARRRSWPVVVYGDLPFMIGRDSADVWARQPQFMADATVGAPPDAFSAEGQDWSLPPWRWQAMRDDGYTWMKARARRSADLFDGLRLDHLVGLYRTYIRPLDPAVPAHFVPPDEADQIALGETLVSIFLASGADIIAEDLGTVPDYVRASMIRLGVPGFRVLRWERRWDEPGTPPIDPREYPELSVATSGTHDTEPLAALPASGVRRPGAGAVPTAPHLVDAKLAALLAAGSSLTLIPLQDAFAWKDRINTPNQVSDDNWTWRVPQPVDTWLDWPKAVARAGRLEKMTRAAGR
jgi:4-alpha-glucanotransferase